MQPKIKIHTADFQRTLRAYMEQTKRSLSEVINQKAYSIMLAASKMTVKADYNKMFMSVGPTASKITGYKIKITKRKVK